MIHLRPPILIHSQRPLPVRSRFDLGLTILRQCSTPSRRPRRAAFEIPQHGQAPAELVAIFGEQFQADRAWKSDGERAREGNGVIAKGGDTHAACIDCIVGEERDDGSADCTAAFGGGKEAVTGTEGDQDGFWYTSLGG